MAPEPVPIPNWVCTLVGRLVLENEAMRLQLDAVPKANDNG